MFLLTVCGFTIFGYKKCNQFDFGINHLVMSMCKVVSCCWRKSIFYDSTYSMTQLVHFTGRVQLPFALLHFVLQGQTCLLLQVYLGFLLLHSHPQWWIEHLFKVLLLGGLLVLHAAAAAKSLQLCLTLCDPIDHSPQGSAVPGILQARTLEWVAISFSNAWKWKVKVKALSHVWFFTTPWTTAYKAPPSMGFSMQEY